MNTNTEKAAFNAGEAKGQTKEKVSNLSTQAGNAFNSAKDTTQQAGQKVAASAQGATEAVKKATGLNK